MEIENIKYFLAIGWLILTFAIISNGYYHLYIFKNNNNNFEDNIRKKFRMYSFKLIIALISVLVLFLMVYKELVSTFQLSVIGIIFLDSVFANNEIKNYIKNIKN